MRWRRTVATKRSSCFLRSRARAHAPTPFERCSRAARPTYRDALAILSLDAEATYFAHRFSDPTYVTAEALLQAIGQQQWSIAPRALDLCGGSGPVSYTHLTLPTSDL